MKGVFWNLARLFQFSGRESRGRFWPYAGCVVVLAFVGIGIGMSTAMAGMFEAAERVAETHPQDVTITRGPASVSVSISGHHPELMPDFGLSFAVMGAVVAVAAVLLAAAVVRRLHDSGRPGWWGLPVPVFLGLGILGMSRLMTMMTAEVASPDAEMFPLFGLIFLNNILYLASLGLLVVFLILPGHPGSNRYGGRADEG